VQQAVVYRFPEIARLRFYPVAGNHDSEDQMTYKILV